VTQSASFRAIKVACEGDLFVRLTAGQDEVFTGMDGVNRIANLPRGPRDRSNDLAAATLQCVEFFRATA
jgi:hypothetical protein